MKAHHTPRKTNRFHRRLLEKQAAKTNTHKTVIIEINTENKSMQHKASIVANVKRQIEQLKTKSTNISFAIIESDKYKINIV